MSSHRVKKTLDDVVYQENEDIVCGSRLPSGQAVICRIMYLCKKAGPGQRQMSAEEACKTVSNELCEIWIHMNVDPLHENSVARKLKDLYDQFKIFCKQSESTKFNKTDGWWKNVRKFNEMMTTKAYDIRTKDAEYQRKLEEKYQVKMTANDDRFYDDNCHGTFKFSCCSAVSASWLKQKNRREKRQRSQEKKKENEQRLGEGTSMRRLSFSEEDSSCESATSEAAFDEIYPTPTDTSRPLTRQHTAEQINEDDQQKQKFPEVKAKQRECSGDSTGQKKLYGAVLNKVIDTVERQLAEVSFFGGDTSTDETKLQYAPITNLGTEGEFAKLDNRIAISGGSTSVKCHRQKNIISTNRLLVDPSFQRLSEEDRMREWKWARTSDATEDAREIEANFLSTVKVTKKLALLKKEELKRKKAGKTENFR